MKDRIYGETPGNRYAQIQVEGTCQNARKGGDSESLTCIKGQDGSMVKQRDARTMLIFVCAESTVQHTSR